MAMIGLRLPPEAARLLSEIRVPGEPVDFGHAHVTLAYLGDGVPIEDVLKAAEVCFDVAQETKPFQCSTRCTDCFPPDEEGTYPIICPVVAPELHLLKSSVDLGLEAAGVEYSKKFPEYHPHTTLTYSEEACEPRLFDPIVWTVFDLVVWGGDHRDSGVVINIPFAFKSLIAKTATKVALRWIGRH